MTKEMMQMCHDAMEQAIESGDQKRIWQAIARSNNAMMDCQHKTRTTQKEMRDEIYKFRDSMRDSFNHLSDKVQTCKEDIIKVRGELAPIKQTQAACQKQRVLMEGRRQGVQWLVRVILIVGGAFGWGAVQKIFEVFTKIN